MNERAHAPSLADRRSRTRGERILLFIPMYDCEAQIGRVIAKFTPRLRDVVEEILVIDNRSRDQGIEACRSALEELDGPKWTIVRNVANYGLGGSHKVAFDYALAHGFDHAVILHGDDQGDFGDILPHLRSGAHREVDCLLGARFMKGSRLVHYSRFRTFGNRVFNGLFSAACGRRLYDLGAGLNCYDMKFLESRAYLRFPNDLTFNYYLLLYSVGTGASLRFFPLTWREEDQVSNVRLFRQTRAMLDVLRRYTISRGRFLTEWHQPPQDYDWELLHSNR